ncbi:thymidine kinase [Candidatus Dependentiae bacterium]|nr:thymidine kinase [Candidatus Dependentiae bacterium]MBU4387142.1 thymidine kinase [Candidatus Dependentiae bacterium]MCG2756729.1 thymidine kinase [Candidatus Dependentiae bacterium]
MNNPKGRLEVICGSMFSGKTEELMRRLGRAEYAKQNVLTIKHQIDNRKSSATILSHNGQERLAFSIDNNKENISKIIDLANKNIQVIGIDEIQFFPIEIVDVIVKLVDMGKTIIVAGLDLDFRGEPFGIMPLIMAIADSVLKLKAICVVCGKDAHHTQRIVNGVPAKYDDPIILVGAKECYEARCRNCFSIDKQAVLVTPAKKYTEKNI